MKPVQVQFRHYLILAGQLIHLLRIRPERTPNKRIMVAPEGRGPQIAGV